ncbi:type II toxin-antitoxin system RelE/ParE family toxin [Pseudomonas syringae]|uniref:type II toxin-antitoxin system RelE/ParE family toxin n=1 Tax=Pseudomonas syringae TaxID=317 RepID=UPI000CD2866D|nr:type II toxin-antitoxin system RelE/ParE family toxin [Pseudomonas syringae]MBS7424351.1 type II toxin-antitoxin system RelE/ParE family toxin [Pseudomonas syringae]MBS7432740.1 type II toxin-antitoxin system RelE/ParE family toxin [Pseudomonas syringae]MCF5649675.1 type II toxin-antitoxin system mRNA interferase toxin, RelE/StbE family [Pseudomonas syringae]POD33645.1 plasmid stabilization protein [Pseudomonas syringae pv. syringae]POD49558.1 plasmid stabilization protein [Pseudomonas syri
MQVEWLKTALKNLDEEAAYIALDNPAAAAAFVKAIQSNVTQLASFPAMGREGRIAGTREWPLPDLPYLIPYRIRSGRLQVLRIFHTRRQSPPVW